MVVIRITLIVSVRVNLWDIGGQKSLRDFWRNYFESNDGLIWVVDSADQVRLQDCRSEFDSLLAEEVKSNFFKHNLKYLTPNTKIIHLVFI